eukprot:TRINITY_DN5354_c0_g1_i1.p1 TRINITY_DN5354_c0_g1~~TRINITY_DN5354_c0_g1_i1.p1  ORF type:complete len:242 (+),score=75.18 TRINITY_DN5354_c0_g1_i1:68-793(+)
MGSWFSSKKKKPEASLNEKDKAILELKRQRVRMQKFKDQAQTVIDKESTMIVTLLKNALKQKALLALKKKKYQQSLLEKTEKQLMNVEELINSIEFAAVQQQVFDALKVGSTCLSNINEQMKIEDVEKIMDDSKEAIEYQNKISEMLGTELTEGDNKAIEEEFAKMQQEMVTPEVPTKPLQMVSASTSTTTSAGEEKEQQVQKPAEEKEQKGEEQEKQKDVAEIATTTTTVKEKKKVVLLS